MLLQSIKERIVSVTSTSCSGRFGDGATAEFVPSIHIGSGARAAWYPGQGRGKGSRQLTFSLVQAGTLPDKSAVSHGYRGHEQSHR